MATNNSKVTIREVYNLLQELREDIRKTYVTRSEFLPIKTTVYGLVGTVLIAVLTAILVEAVGL